MGEGRALSKDAVIYELGDVKILREDYSEGVVGR